jgi:hypothetical protein
LIFDLEECSSSGTKIALQLPTEGSPQTRETARVSTSGAREDVIKIAQQLAWLSTVFRVPKEGKLTCSEFVVHETGNPEVFTVRLLKLQDIGVRHKACWHPLFYNGVLAHGFPIRPRNGELGVELPFEAMTYLAGIIGPVEYKGGLVLKGYSTMIFPKSLPSPSVNSEEKSAQWHLVYDGQDTLATLSSLAKEQGRALYCLSSLKSLTHARTFLGCYKKVDIHLGTENAAYDRIAFSQANPSSQRPEFSGFSLGLSLAKVVGISGTGNFTIPKRLSMTRQERSYEQILSYSSTMPIILYDTSDRRAWMVPALAVILHMIHIWASLQKEKFPTLTIPSLPYAKPACDIGRAAQEVIYENSNLQLYISKDDNQPYFLKDRVKQYWLELETAIAAEKDHQCLTGKLHGWELMEVVSRDPLSEAKEPSVREFRGNWSGLASDPNMIVLFCRGLGEVIVPNSEAQKLCSEWKSVPTEKDYLTASVKCILQCSNRFSGPGNCSQLGHAVFLQFGQEDTLFADCLHEERRPCQRVQELVRKCSRSQSTTCLEQEGAIVFGHRQKKLQKQPTQLRMSRD